MSHTFVFVGATEVASELASNMLEAGFKAASGVDTADVIFTFTPFLEDTEEVYFGSEGMIATAKEGAYLVNLSATTPSLTHEISAMAQVSNMHAIDAPLFVHDAGRVHAYSDRTNLGMFVGGAKDDIDALRCCLEALAGSIEVCGEAGSGQLAKAAASLQRASLVVGLIEADSLCRVAQGSEDASSVMQHTFATAPVSAEIASLYSAITSRQLDSSYTAEIMLGEIVSALSAADDLELILPQAESAEYLLQLLCTIGGVGKSSSALSLVYCDEAECARYGLDWSRAEQAFEQMDDHDCDCGHDHHGHRDHGHGSFNSDEDDMFGFGYSPN